jgi:hypothetical protein
MGPCVLDVQIPVARARAGVRIVVGLLAPEQIGAFVTTMLRFPSPRAQVPYLRAIHRGLQKLLESGDFLGARPAMISILFMSAGWGTHGDSLTDAEKGASTR